MRVSISNARTNLGRFINITQGKCKPIVITKRGVPAAVLMSYTEYESLRETALVASDGLLMRDIRKGLRDLRAKKTRLYTLDELFSS